LSGPYTIALPFGNRRIDIAVNGDLIVPRAAEPVADEEAAVQAALDYPIGSPPLSHIVKRGERVAIIVNDITRLTRTELLLPPLLATLNQAGIPDSDIFIVFALGIHRPQTAAEQRQIVGEVVAARIRMFDHICTDDASLVIVGTTSFGNVVEINREVWEADRIILTGEIIYHLIAGYSGGRKSLVPGVAGFRTTTFNHRMIFDPRSRPGVLEGNPAHEDLLEGCRMVGPDFIVNVVLTPEGKLASVVAGHFELAHREGCRAVDSMSRCEVAEPYDLIVASAGGFPVDIDLRQAHKGLENACLALRTGGSILFFAECPNGAGIQSFEDYVYRYDDEFEMRKALEDNFVVGGHKAFWIARLGRLYDVQLVSTCDPEFVARCHFQHVPVGQHQAALQKLIAKHGPGARVAVIPYAGFTLPACDKVAEAVTQ
jgi:nickel-dependent lactate racemase